MSSNSAVVPKPAQNALPSASKTTPKRGLLGILWHWGPAVLWLGAIAMFSGSHFSAQNTGGVLARILLALHIELTSAQFDLLHFFIRKSAHFVAYATLSGLFFRAWRGPIHLRNWRVKWVLLTLAVCLLTASADEIHQLFTPGRTGAAKDVMLDMSGALFMQLVIVTATAKRRQLETRRRWPSRSRSRLV